MLSAQLSSCSHEIKKEESCPLLGCISLSDYSVWKHLVIVMVVYFFIAQQPNAAQERVKIDELDTLTTRSEICGSTTIPTSEFHFLVKSGNETPVVSLEDINSLRVATSKTSHTAHYSNTPMQFYAIFHSIFEARMCDSFLFMVQT